MQNYTLFEEYITLGQVIKELAIVNTGGQAKLFLAENEGNIFLNKTAENRRGKKLRAGDILEIPKFELFIKFVQASAEEVAAYEEDRAEEERVKALVKKMNAQVKSQKPKKATKPRFPGAK
ncbi:MAG TPA: hypothetical protein DCZ00_00755 [Lactococcus sp.]|uniref:RNA-binding S4 domain-containing protein n=1 Tax=Lactococcus muris TaxID=2941330 RepID=A0ABV4D8Q6_9LACT|nr:MULTISPECIES: RNA-binding S4 domain-containing protein [Lactococcus]HBC89957.1 hypothetical protein [Lactococcus sp.]